MRPLAMRAALAIALGAWLPAQAANPAEGRAVFEDMCSDCHTVTPGKHKRGPSLAGIIGSKSASAPNYNYSDALRQASITWTPARLAQYLAAPKKDIPGTKMRLLTQPTAQEISDLITWLQHTR